MNHELHEMKVHKPRESEVEGVAEPVAKIGQSSAEAYVDVETLSPLLDTQNVSLEEDNGKAPSCLAAVCLLVGNIIPYGGTLSTCFNVSSTIIGGGILGLPSAFQSIGISMAVVYLVLISTESVYSIKLLVEASEKSGCKTLESLAVVLLHRYMGIFVGVVRAVFCFGACVAYVIAVADVLSTILTHADNVPSFLLTNVGTHVIQAAAWLVCMLPLVIPRDINSLRYVSAVGVIFILYFAVIIIVHSCMNGLQQDPRPETVIFNTGNVAVQGLGSFIFSFVNQFNCLDIYAEMLNRSLTRFLICSAASVGLCCGIYIMSGLFGYMDFGSRASDSLLKLYNPIAEPQILVAFIGVFIKLCASYGLLSNGCRNSIYHIIGWDPLTVAFWKHLIAVLIIAVLTIICGIFIPDINMVFGFVGGVCGGFIGFILPALYMMYSGNWTLKSVGIVNYVCTYLVLIAGVVAIVFGTGSTIYGAAIR